MLQLPNCCLEDLKTWSNCNFGWEGIRLDNGQWKEWVFVVVLSGHEIIKLFTTFSCSTRPGAKYIEKYSNTLQLLSLINDYNYIIITGPVEM